MATSATMLNPTMISSDTTISAKSTKDIDPVVSFPGTDTPPPKRIKFDLGNARRRKDESLPPSPPPISFSSPLNDDDDNMPTIDYVHTSLLSLLDHTSGASRNDQAAAEYRRICDAFRQRRGDTKIGESPSSSILPSSLKYLRALTADPMSNDRCVLSTLATRPEIYGRLIHIILRTNPFKHGPEFVKAHIDFCVGLVSANAVLCHNVFEMLIKFGLLMGWEDSNNSVERLDSVHAVLDSVHAVIKSLLHLVPSAASTLLRLLISELPHAALAAPRLLYYCNAALNIVLVHVPVGMGQILEHVIRRALEMDVEIEVLEGGEVIRVKQDKEEDYVEKNIFEPEENEMKEIDLGKVDEMADKLDSLMLLLFHQITPSDTSDSKAKVVTVGGILMNISTLSPSESYKLIFPIFLKCVLTTHKSKFVQFLIFYICGLDYDASQARKVCASDTQEQHETLARSLLSSLLYSSLDATQPTVIRQSASCYLASLVARASYVDAETAVEVISGLLDHCLEYMRKFDKSGKIVVVSAVSSLQKKGSARSNEQHAAFYTICQAALYILCFRGHEALDFFTSSSYSGYNIGKDRWTKLCQHALNPLRTCLESIRREFLAIAETFSLLPLSEINRHRLKNVRIRKAAVALPKRSFAIKTAATAEIIGKKHAEGVGGLGPGGSNPLDSFFPFDPYLLRRSHDFVEMYYREWNGHKQSLESQMMDAGRSEDCDDGTLLDHIVGEDTKNNHKDDVSVLSENPRDNEDERCSNAHSSVPSLTECMADASSTCRVLSSELATEKEECGQAETKKWDYEVEDEDEEEMARYSNRTEQMNRKQSVGSVGSW